MTTKNNFEIPDIKALSFFFEKERKKTLVVLQNRLSMDVDDAEDIFQEASIVLYNNIQNGKLEKLTASLSTYFTRICINLGLKLVTRRRPTIPLPEYDISEDTLMGDEYDMGKIDYLLGLDESINEEQEKMMREIVQDLPHPCEKILWSFYGDNLTMTEIASLIGFNGADSVKSKKSWCMGRLKERFDKIKSFFYDK